MSHIRLRYPASTIAGKSRLDRDDILILRKHVFPEGLQSGEQAGQLLYLHRSADETSPEWDAWLVETLTAFIVFHSWPQYSLDRFNADWIVAAIAPRGIVETAAELEFLMHVIDVSRAVPDRLSILALDQVRLAFDRGKGAYAAGRSLRRAGLGREDVDYIYRILKGSYRAGKMALTQGEATVLWRLRDSLGKSHCHPAWHDLLRVIDCRDAEGQVTAGPWLRILESGGLEDVA